MGGWSCFNFAEIVFKWSNVKQMDRIWSDKNTAFLVKRRKIAVFRGEIFWYQLTLNCLFPLSCRRKSFPPKWSWRSSQLELRELVEGKSYRCCVPSLLEQHWIERFFLWFPLRKLAWKIRKFPLKNKMVWKKCSEFPRTCYPWGFPPFSPCLPQSQPRTCHA